MKIRQKISLFESWKSIPFLVLVAKLVTDGILFFMCSSITTRIYNMTSKYSLSDYKYVCKFSWFMYLCFGIMMLFDIIMILRIILAKQKKLHNVQLNTELDLFKKNSRLRAERFCFTTMLWLIVPFVLMTGYIKRLLEEILPLTIFVYVVIYIVMTIISVKSRKKTAKKLKYSNDRLTFLKASKVQYDNFSFNLFDQNAVIIENLTDYMISSFSTGNFSENGVIFYDLNNELVPWLGDVLQFKKDMFSLRNRIVVADCDKIQDLGAFIKRVYDNYRHNSSKYACLTVGLVNAKKEISEKDFDLGLAKDISIISFSSYNVLELLSLVIGRIPVMREIGTAEENNEVVRLANELNELVTKTDLIERKYNDIFSECIDISSEHFNGTTEPDYSYAVTCLILENIKTRRMKSVFFSRICCHYLADPERRLCSQFHNIITPEINHDNEFLYSIFKNIIFESSEVKRIMGLFDYIDFMLRTVAIYSFVKNGGKADDFEIESTFCDLAKQILNNTPNTNRTIRKTVSFSQENPVEFILAFVKEYFNLISATSSIDFCGLCHLIDIVRNKTRGHGSIKEENSCIIQCFLLVAIELLHDMLDIKSFNIIVENNMVFMGYGTEKYNCSNIVYVKDGLPCIPIRMQGENKEYINFFKGKYIIPDFVVSE